MQGYGVMAGTHSILNVKPTYADVNGNIYQDRFRKRNGGITVIKKVEQTARYKKGTQTIERYIVQLVLADGKDKRHFAVGRVVLAAFNPKVWAEQNVEHLDGVVGNNKPWNLINCKCLKSGSDKCGGHTHW